MRYSCVAILLAAAPVQAQRSVLVFDRSTNISVRFLRSVESGRDTTGELVIAQTLSPLGNEDCTAVPAYVQLAGHITNSRPGGRFGRRGQFRIAFDSVQVQVDRWLPLHAVLDTVEYVGALHAGGTVYGARPSVVRHMSTAGAITAVAASAVEEFPAALLGTYWALRRGPRAQLLAGETGSVSLTEPLEVPAEYCVAPAPSRTTNVVLPADFPTATRSGHRDGDPINFIIAGNAAQVDSAFRAAGWKRTQRRRPVSIAKSIFSTIAAVPASNPPVSNQFLFGRAEDVAYELEGPNARIRHHIRLWEIGGPSHLWIGAATLDDGLNLKKRTHRIDPRIDQERDLLVRELEAGGRAHLSEYVMVPGAKTSGRLAHSQAFVSDGRAAVVLTD